MTPKIHKYDNGMVLIYLPFKGYNTFYADLAVRQGSFGDPDGLTGLAHLVEHVQANKALKFLRGKRDGGHIADDFSAYTRDRRVNYSCTGHRKHFRVALEALSLCVTSEVDPAEFAYEKERVSMEIKSELRDASGIHALELRRSVFSSIGGGHLEFGTEGSVKKIGVQDAAEYLRDVYCGRFLVLVVAGDLDYRNLVKDVGLMLKVAPGRAPGKLSMPKPESNIAAAKKGGVKHYTRSWVTKPSDMKSNLLAETLTEDFGRHLKDTVGKEFGLYSVWADFTRYDGFSWLTVNAEVPGGRVEEFDKAVVEEVGSYSESIGVAALSSVIRSARTDLELQQDFPQPAAQAAQWHYLMFGEVVTPKALSALLRKAEVKEARSVFRAITGKESTVVIT